jgi:hypothetical protein
VTGNSTHDHPSSIRTFVKTRRFLADGPQFAANQGLGAPQKIALPAIWDAVVSEPAQTLPLHNRRAGDSPPLIVIARGFQQKHTDRVKIPTLDKRPPQDPNGCGDLRFRNQHALNALPTHSYMKYLYNYPQAPISTTTSSGPTWNVTGKCLSEALGDNRRNALADEASHFEGNTTMRRYLQDYRHCGLKDES